MKGSKRENLLLAVLLGLTGAFLIISYYKVMAGPLRSVLESEATWTMLGEVVLVFAWNLFWLRRAYGGKRDKGAGCRIRYLCGGPDPLGKMDPSVICMEGPADVC